MQPNAYPVQFAVDYPDRPLHRLTTFLRVFVAVPILIVLGTEPEPLMSWRRRGSIGGQASYGSEG